MQLLKKYTRLLQIHPYKTKISSAMLTFAFSDLICQKFVEKKPKIDWKRNVMFFCVGGFSYTPIIHVWFRSGLPYISRKLMPRLMPKMYGNPPTKLKRVLMEVLHHQSYFSTFFNMVFLIQVSTLRNGKFWDNTKNTFWKMPRVMYQNVKFWPAVNFVNFYWFPLEYRVLCINIVAIFWVIYLSWVQQNTVRELRKKQLLAIEQDQGKTEKTEDKS